MRKKNRASCKKYLRRSWTGQLIDVAEIDYRPDAILIHRLHCTGNAVDENPVYTQAVILSLIQTHLHGKSFPFPIPTHLSDSPVRDIALFGFNQYGRLALWGTMK